MECICLLIGSSCSFFSCLICLPILFCSANVIGVPTSSWSIVILSLSRTLWPSLKRDVPRFLNSFSASIFRSGSSLLNILIALFNLMMLEFQTLQAKWSNFSYFTLFQRTSQNAGFFTYTPWWAETVSSKPGGDWNEKNGSTILYQKNSILFDRCEYWPNEIFLNPKDICTTWFCSCGLFHNLPIGYQFSFTLLFIVFSRSVTVWYQNQFFCMNFVFIG